MKKLIWGGVIVALLAIPAIAGVLLTQKQRAGMGDCGPSFICPLTDEPICPCCCPLNR